jgi:Rrf2 family transcriptional regulator, nitric oxide-sensitive transcriptional repressor
MSGLCAGQASGWRKGSNQQQPYASVFIAVMPCLVGLCRIYLWPCRGQKQDLLYTLWSFNDGRWTGIAGNTCLPCSPGLTAGRKCASVLGCGRSAEDKRLRLTNYTDYTLRTLIYLALTTDRLVTIAEISEHYGISEAHLNKVVHQLGLAGDIETVRGKGGGLRLGRPPEAIRVGDVVQRCEPDLVLVPCFGEQGVCAIEPDCVLQKAMQGALTAFLKELNRYRLADLIAPRRKLAALLGLPGAARESSAPAKAGVA